MHLHRNVKLGHKHCGTHQKGIPTKTPLDRQELQDQWNTIKKVKDHNPKGTNVLKNQKKERKEK